MIIQSHIGKGLISQIERYATQRNLWCEEWWCDAKNYDCQKDFETLKGNISQAPILRGPNWKLPFHISTYASDTALGAILGKKRFDPLCHLLHKQEFDSHWVKIHCN